MIFPGFPGVLSFFQVEWEPSFMFSRFHLCTRFFKASGRSTIFTLQRVFFCSGVNKYILHGGLGGGSARSIELDGRF